MHFVRGSRAHVLISQEKLSLKQSTGCKAAEDHDEAQSARMCHHQAEQPKVRTMTKPVNPTATEIEAMPTPASRIGDSLLAILLDREIEAAKRAGLLTIDQDDENIGLVTHTR